MDRVYNKRKRVWQRKLVEKVKYIRKRGWLPARRAVRYKKQVIRYRSKRVFRNKKPFWRWKSYKAVTFAKRAFRSLYNHAKKRGLRDRSKRAWKQIGKSFFQTVYFKKRNVKISKFARFVRSNRLRYFYKNKLYMNLYFARLFEYRSGREIRQFRKYLKNKRTRLNYFLHYFLSRLDFVIWRWFGHWAHEEGLWTLRKCQLMIYYGLVLINFKPKITYLYRAKPQDCIVLTVGGQRAFGFYWKFYRANFLEFGKTKYRSGYYVQFKETLKWRKKKIKRTSKPVKIFKWIKTRLWFESKALVSSLYETSKRIRAFVYVLPHNRFNWVKHAVMINMSKNRMRRAINYFVNMSYL